MHNTSYWPESRGLSVATVRSTEGPQTRGRMGPDTDLCYDGGDSDVSENKTLQTEIEMPLEEGR